MRSIYVGLDRKPALQVMCIWFTARHQCSLCSFISSKSLLTVSSASHEIRRGQTTCRRADVSNARFENETLFRGRQKPLRCCLR